MMILRGCRPEIRGKLVGRVGIEPTTKRLRVASPSRQFPCNFSISSLIWAPRSRGIVPHFSSALRGALASRRTTVWTRPDRLETGDGRESTAATSLPETDRDSRCPVAALSAGDIREPFTPAPKGERMSLHAGRRLATVNRHSRVKQESPQTA